MDMIAPHPGAEAVAVEMTARLEQIAHNLQREVSRLGGVRGGGDAEVHLDQLKNEVRGMGRLIADTRAEVAGLLPPGVAGSRLASASNELDAVVGATERAAVEIMGAAERAQEAAQRLRRVAALPPEACRDVDVVEGAATDIFMACSFQDLTGQRIRKVVHALTYIEQRVNALTLLWQGETEGEGPPLDHRQDSHLLNGPGDGLEQHDVDAVLDETPTEAVSQDDIDALFS